MPSYGEVGTMAMTMTKEKEKGILTVRLNIGLGKKDLLAWELVCSGDDSQVAAESIRKTSVYSCRVR